MTEYELNGAMAKQDMSAFSLTPDESDWAWLRSYRQVRRLLPHRSDWPAGMTLRADVLEALATLPEWEAGAAAVLSATKRRK